MLAPLLDDDIDPDSFAALPAPGGRALLAQGLQRSLTASSEVTHAPRATPALLRACTPATSVFLSSKEIAGWAPGEIDRVVARAGRVIVTRGADGAEVLAHGAAPLHVDACPARAIDPTGAGEAFATAFMLSLADGPLAAVRVASVVVAAAVEVRGPAPLPARDVLLRRLAAARGGGP
ncbi:MAG: hypothetical protein EXR65_01645 [Dehalococcoidia bacterium]|nr:hypothetical protein [Dehalococcoidia bacterium]